MRDTAQSDAPFVCCAVCGALYTVLSPGNTLYTAREALWGALAAFAAAAALLRLWEKGVCAVCRRGLAPDARRALAAIWCVLLAAAAVSTALCMGTVYARQYAGGLWWLALLAAALLLVRPTPGSLTRAAWAVLALSALTACLLLAGLAGQLRWQRLSFTALRGPMLAQAFWASFCRCPELLAMPVPLAKKSWRAPAAAAAVCGAGALLAELLFGYTQAQGCYPALEAVRAWGLGLFSRMDSLAVGLWLLLALFRLLFLQALLRRAAAALRAPGIKSGDSPLQKGERA